MAKYETKQRRILLDYLSSHSDEELSASKIADALKECGVSQSAVYRNLASLQKSGAIKKVAVGNGNEGLFLFVSGHDECKNSIHLSCKKCGKMFHLKSNICENLVDGLKMTEDFSVDKESTVLYGLCKDCK